MLLIVRRVQLIDIPRPISSYCFYKDIFPSPKPYPNLLHLLILHISGDMGAVGGCE